MNRLPSKRIIYVVNVDWFFISHRLPLALESRKRGWEVYLLAKNTGRFPELERMSIKCIDINFERSGTNPFKELLLIQTLKTVYRELIPTIIHHITLKPAIYGTIAAHSTFKSGNVAIVNAVSGLGFSFIASRRWIGKFIIIKLMKYAFRNHKSRFIFQNPDDLQYYQKLGFLRNGNFILIKGSGVDENLFTLKKVQSNKLKVRITLAARMLKDKGILEFIAAAKLLKEKYEEKLEFVLIGNIDADNPASLTKEKIMSLLVDNYIIWLGFQENVKYYYQNSDIVCLPSYREGLPKSLIEAMAVGCPIITTDAVGCRECVDEGYNGFLVPVGDYKKLAERIEILTNDEEMRIKMGYNSRQKMLREMSLSRVIRETFDFYDS